MIEDSLDSLLSFSLLKHSLRSSNLPIDPLRQKTSSIYVLFMLKIQICNLLKTSIKKDMETSQLLIRYQECNHFQTNHPTSFAINIACHQIAS